MCADGEMDNLFRSKKNLNPENKNLFPKNIREFKKIVRKARILQLRKLKKEWN